MYRCPQCGRPLRFYGITTVRTWLRWDFCHYCDVGSTRTETGKVVYEYVGAPTKFFPKRRGEE